MSPTVDRQVGLRRTSKDIDEAVSESEITGSTRSFKAQCAVSLVDSAKFHPHPT